MLRNTILLIFCLLTISNSSPNKESPPTKERYTLEDLEILAGEKNYYEFFNHALDLLPKERPFHWKDMVQSMANQFIRDQIEKKIVNTKDFQLIEELFTWPVLGQDETFRYLRVQYGKDYFNEQLKLLPNNTPATLTLLKEMETFWKKESSSPHLGYALAKLALTKGEKEESIWNYLKTALKSLQTNTLCQDKEVQAFLLKKIYKELLQPDFAAVLAPWINDHISPTCWQEIVVELKKGLFYHELNISSFIYTLLRSQKQLNSTEEDLYLTYFILQGPFNGDVFNYAWNRLTQLGENFSRRQNVLKGLQKMDPLPGGLFGLPNLKRKEVILDHFFKYFPEYLDLYARSCTEYLAGTKLFPNGNPTIYCDELFQLSLNKNWITDSLKKQYTEFTQHKKGLIEAKSTRPQFNTI